MRERDHGSPRACARARVFQKETRGWQWQNNNTFLPKTHTDIVSRGQRVVEGQDGASGDSDGIIVGLGPRGDGRSSSRNGVSQGYAEGDDNSSLR